MKYTGVHENDITAQMATPTAAAGAAGLLPGPETAQNGC